MRARGLRSILLILSVALSLAGTASAQLRPPPVPRANPLTEEKRVLGKILFWDEQLSSDNTMACGTCHDPSRGGGDARAAFHPGPNGVFGDLDDKLGSSGVRLTAPGGDYVASPVFGLEPQVTARAANSFLMAAYAPEVFWDGRAGRTFVDPDHSPGVGLIVEVASL